MRQSASSGAVTPLSFLMSPREYKVTRVVGKRRRSACDETVHGEWQASREPSKRKDAVKRDGDHRTEKHTCDRESRPEDVYTLK